jgi:hypothetical protein
VAFDGIVPVIAQLRVEPHTYGGDHLVALREVFKLTSSGYLRVKHSQLPGLCGFELVQSGICARILRDNLLHAAGRGLAKDMSGGAQLETA